MTDPNFHLETPRLYISYFIATNDAHCEFLVRLYNSPEFIASIGGKPTSVTTTAAARHTIEGPFLHNHVRNGYGPYLVSLKPETSETTTNPRPKSDCSFADRLKTCKPIGSVSLMRGDYTAPDIGFAILPEETRKGYATEAAKALIAYAKRELGVDAVLGFYEKGNEASRRVMEKLGFEDRGARGLAVFGGVQSEVWAAPWTDQDLKVYGID